MAMYDKRIRKTPTVMKVIITTTLTPVHRLKGIFSPFASSSSRASTRKNSLIRFYAVQSSIYSLIQCPKENTTTILNNIRMDQIPSTISGNNRQEKSHHRVDRSPYERAQYHIPHHQLPIKSGHCYFFFQRPDQNEILYILHILAKLQKRFQNPKIRILHSTQHGTKRGECHTITKEMKSPACRHKVIPHFTTMLVLLFLFLFGPLSLLFSHFLFDSSFVLLNPSLLLQRFWRIGIWRICVLGE